MSISSEEYSLWPLRSLNINSTDVCLYYIPQDLTWLPMSQKVHKGKHWASYEAEKPQIHRFGSWSNKNNDAAVHKSFIS